MPQQIDFDPALDYYKSLGVTSSATGDEIKKAYRKLAKQYHPDSTGGDKAKETRFKEISNAYDVLGDTAKRKLYDEIRANGGRAAGGMPGTRTPRRMVVLACSTSATCSGSFSQAGRADGCASSMWRSMTRRAVIAGAATVPPK